MGESCGDGLMAMILEVFAVCAEVEYGSAKL